MKNYENSKTKLSIYGEGAMMQITINQIYNLCIRVLPSSDRLRLATLLLNDLVHQESTVIDESDSWTDEDIADLSNFSLQYAATIYPDDEDLI
ncbi:MAG: hypothetical protein ACO3EZ_12700 [Prochlorotrichaceae cyanobacterium]|jgi:hypothetical protein